MGSPDVETTSADPPGETSASPPTISALSLGDVHAASLGVLAVLGIIFTLSWARAVVIPVMFGIILSYALDPIVDRLQRWHIPRAIGAALLLLTIVGGIGTLGYALQDDAVELIETLPDAARNLRNTIRKQGMTTPAAMGQVQEAARELERAAQETGVQDVPAMRDGITRVEIVEPKLNIEDYLWTGTLGAVGLLGQISVVLFLVYFLLAIGDTFRRKLVKITGPALSKKKVTVQVLDEITAQIQRYLLVQIATSALVGVASWLAFRALGLEHAAVWGILAGVFNTIPYIGPVLVTGGTALVALLQFGTPGMALLVSSVAFLITSLEGYLLTPWLTGRAGRMNPVVVFVGVLFWGWLWGVWGLLLGIPIVMIVKAVCDRVEDLRPVGELLGE